jgi:hypothetical protein
MRRLLIVVAAVLALGCVTVGAIAATNSNAEAGVPSTSIQEPSSTVANVDQVEFYLDALKDRLTAAGVEFLDVSTEGTNAEMTKVVRGGSTPEDLLPLVCISLPVAALQGPEGMLTLETVRRQAVYALRDGAPIKFLAIVGIDEQGNAVGPDLSYIGDYAPSDEWKRPALQATDKTEATIAASVSGAARRTGIPSCSTELAESPDGRTVTVGAKWSRTIEARPGELANLANIAVLEANRGSGSKVATLVVRIEGDEGALVATYVFDYALGAMISGSWVSPVLADDPAFDAEWMK